MSHGCKPSRNCLKFEIDKILHTSSESEIHFDPDDYKFNTGRKLYLHDCKNTKSLKGIEVLCEKLGVLSLIGCHNLADISGIQNLKLLTWLSIRDCDYLRCKPQFLDRLARFTTDNYNILTNIFSKIMLHIKIVNCFEITSVAEVMRFTTLTKLEILRCPNVVSLHGIANLKQLTELSINFCDDLKTLDDIKELTKLSHLTVSGCQNLKTLGGIGELSRLIELTDFCLTDCYDITCVKEIQYFIKLINLDLSFCSNLLDIPDNVICLKHLKRININGCTSLPEILLPANNWCADLSWYRWGGNDKLYVIGALSDRIKKNTNSWSRHVHESFGSDVNELYAAVLLGLQRICSYDLLPDPELVEETLEKFLQLDRHTCQVEELIEETLEELQS